MEIPIPPERSDRRLGQLATTEDIATAALAIHWAAGRFRMGTVDERLCPDDHRSYLGSSVSKPLTLSARPGCLARGHFSDNGQPVIEVWMARRRSDHRPDSSRFLDYFADQPGVCYVKRVTATVPGWKLSRSKAHSPADPGSQLFFAGLTWTLIRTGRIRPLLSV